MKRLKQGVSLVVVLGALVVASFGGAGSFTANPSGLSIDSTYVVTKDGDSQVGTLGLHW